MYRKELEYKLMEYKSILKKLEEGRSADIEGSLRISVDRGKTRYYVYTDSSNTVGEYINKDDIELARALAQKTYNEKVYSLVKKRIKQLEIILKDYHDREVDELYEKLHYVRKELVTPVEMTWEQKHEMWIAEKYVGKDFINEKSEIYSEKKERVRSKTEKILADYFFNHNIPYKYEKPLRLNGYGVVYPDFTFLSPKTGKEIYWEHDGRMDDPDYARKAIKKLESYENNGIYVGERLIVTYESSDKILGTREIERNVRRFLV